MAWFIPLIIAAVTLAVSFVLMPKIKRAKPAGMQDLEEPTAEAGRPVAKVWGTITVKDPNVLWSGDKSVKTYEVKA